MKILYFSLCVLFFFPFPLMTQDTFSVVAVDPETGEIGAAGATCVDGIAQWGGIQLLNKIIPGKGGVNAQAWICLNPHINLDNAITQMDEGMSPEEIIAWLQENDACSSQGYNPQYRQYGIVDLDVDNNPRTAAFTGSLADDHKGHRLGETYSIQGNILLGPQILDDMETGFVNESESLAHKLMMCMQGANVPGADSRCLERGTSSTSAFLRVVRPDDDPNDPYLELSILEMPFGQEPIDSLQALFDAWAATLDVASVALNQKLVLSPNPVQGALNVYFNDFKIENYGIYNASGKAIKIRSHLGENPLVLDLSNLESGVYFIKVQAENSIGVSRFIKE